MLGTASAVQSISRRSVNMNLDRDVRSGDTFDFIVAHRRAATGERRDTVSMLA